jgi:glycosyltransferase involved in cell wall biosynthesis
MPTETTTSAKNMQSQALIELLTKSICFAGNSWAGRGGQGEFLRQMVLALDYLPGATVYSRSALARMARSVSLPLRFPWRQLCSVVSSPVLRRRKDWLTLLSDLEFDCHVAAEIGQPDLFDGVMGQCCQTFERLRGRGTRLVLTCLNTHIDNLVNVLESEHRIVNYPGHHSFHRWMRDRSLREIELADCIRVNSGWAKQTFIDRGTPAGKIHVIHPGIDLEHFRPVAKKDDVFRVLTVASIDPRKGVHYLLRAFEEAKIPRSELVLIGGTGDAWSKRMLQDFLSRNPNIRQCFMDVTTAPVSESYGSASVLVHPALEDGYGLVVPQALASGRPVIVTRSSGASELVHDGKNGFVVESRSVEQLRNRLQLLANDRNLRESMSKGARATVTHLGYSDFIRRVLGFYWEVLDGWS